MTLATQNSIPVYQKVLKQNIVERKINTSIVKRVILVIQSCINRLINPSRVIMTNSEF